MLISWMEVQITLWGIYFPEQTTVFQALSAAVIGAPYPLGPIGQDYIDLFINRVYQ